MNFSLRCLGAALLAGSLAGCTTVHHKAVGGAPAPVMPAQGQEADAATEIPAERMLVWRAELTLEVGDLTNATARASETARSFGGFVEQKSDSGDQSARLVLRIPSKSLAPALSSLETLGDVQRRWMSSQDVTEQYVDVAARLKNKIALRDRLKELLAKATAVKDVLAIETELNRVQADIDSMEGRIKSLKGQADYATVEVSLERKPILGPVGYVFKGLWWGVRKLFVIRD